MLKAKDIRKALRELVNKKADIPYTVHFNHVNKSNKSYVWIEIRPRKVSWDKVYFHRILNIDIQVVLVPDEYTEVKYTDLYDISDKLDAAIMPCVKIEDRYITVQECNSYIVDDVLHYEFNLDFTDYVPNEEYEGLAYELMQRLEVRLNKKTPLSVYFDEGDEDNGEIGTTTNRNNI